jgi:hypothetical protein
MVNYLNKLSKVVQAYPEKGGGSMEISLWLD